MHWRRKCLEIEDFDDEDLNDGSDDEDVPDARDSRAYSSRIGPNSDFRN